MPEEEASVSAAVLAAGGDDETPSTYAARPLAVPFRDLGVAEVICTSLEAVGIATTFPIQALVLPLAIGGHDIIGQARTGTGKTLAFGVPMLQRLVVARADAAGSPKAPTGLVVVPTRELAFQVAEDIDQAGKDLRARVLTVYGGRAYEPQIDALKAGTDIVVGTPGRLLDLANRKDLDLSQVRTLVLDEADKMLDLGFLPDVERILRQTPGDRQTMLFSATMPGEVVTLARKHMRRPTNVRAEDSGEGTPTPLTTQYVYRTHHLDKIEVLARVLQAKDRGLAMVFCQTKRAADQVATALGERGFASAAVHGDLGQAQRERALRAFRSGKVDVLVATDVAARGIDVEAVTHVINYECPDDEKAYVHRIGRTGRAGREGVAVTFVDWADLQRWKLINDTLGLAFPAPAETYSTSERLYSELSIPPDATGRLPVELRARAGLSAEAEEDIGETGRTRSHPSRDKSDGRESTRSRTRTSRRDLDQIAGGGSRGGGLAAGGSASGTDGVAAAPDGTAAPERSRRRRRLRAGQDISQDAGLAPNEPATTASDTSAAQDAPVDATLGDDAHEDTSGQRAPRQRATRARSADPTSTAPRRSADPTSTAPRRTAQASPQAADLDTEDEDGPVRPLVASTPITMHAAPGVPAAIFQAPV
ncbi:MAG: box helicase domain protein [Actinomycetia bacterium]|nr:box helicase domain protein [Actinomycetes bacterium]